MFGLHLSIHSIGDRACEMTVFNGEVVFERKG